MENASKALIIAGAILLAIVIISLGLIVVNNTRNTVENANTNEQEIQAFNAKFISYEGQNVSATKVNTLIQQVIATNQVSLENGKDATKNCIIIGIKDKKTYISSNLNSSNQSEIVAKILTGSDNVKSDGDKTWDASFTKYTGSVSVDKTKSYTVKLFYSSNTGLVHYIYIE